MIRIANGPVLGAKVEDGSGLLGTDARELEKLGWTREIHSDCLRHECPPSRTRARSPPPHRTLSLRPLPDHLNRLGLRASEAPATPSIPEGVVETHDPG